MSYREVTPQWVAKQYNDFLNALPKSISFEVREKLAYSATKVAIDEFKYTKPLDDFFKPQLEDMIKILNYQGPIFQRAFKLALSDFAPIEGLQDVEK